MTSGSAPNFWNSISRISFSPKSKIWFCSLYKHILVFSHMWEDTYVQCLNSYFNENKKEAFSVALIKLTPTASVTVIGIFKTSFQLAICHQKSYTVWFYMIYFLHGYPQSLPPQAHTPCHMPGAGTGTLRIFVQLHRAMGCTGHGPFHRWEQKRYNDQMRKVGTMYWWLK